jgi:hypothetical protein
MKTEKFTLLFVMAVCLYFGIEIAISGAYLWVKLLACSAFFMVILGCLDAFISLTHSGKEERE